MPRRNLVILVAVGIISLMCYQKVHRNQYGQIFVEVMDQIEQRSLEPVGQEDLFLGAMEGMVGRLHDPHSMFFSPRASEEFNEDLDQEFGGVGMQVGYDKDTNQLAVMSPLVGSPAFEAGVLAGDKILRIDGKSTQGLSLADAVGHMRGKPGEPVVISVLHEGDDQPVDIEIIREIIELDTVLGDTREADGSWNFFLEGHDRIGYLRITSFAKRTPDEMDRALQWLVDRDMQGLILDFRDNPGGLLTAAIAMCDRFIKSGTIVTTRRRDGQISRRAAASAQDTLADFPMAVLVNQLSASASEIVSACLQDHGRAVVVGQRSWGKGTVQEVIELPDNQGMLKLTTASFWRPSEKNIHRKKDATDKDDWGVSPNDGYEVVVEDDELVRLRMWRSRRDAFQPDGNGDEP
ncbi:MAG TPA: S41 family peptidase, partial [Thermoguttaceae bacterium]|nr:S41 family peptidase [Thermoguttaceae bacterium]